MELTRIPVLVTTLAILLGAIFIGASSNLIGQTQVEAQGPGGGGGGKAWSLSWASTIDTNFASIVAIGFFDGSSPSEHVSVLTSRPEVVTMTVRDGIILDKSRLRMTSFPVADQFFAQSRDGTIVAWIDLQKGGPVLVIFSPGNNQKQIVALDYIVPNGLTPSPTVLSVGSTGQMIAVGDRNGVVALYEN